MRFLITVFVLFYFLYSPLVAQSDTVDSSNKIDVIISNNDKDYFRVAQETTTFSLKELKELYKKSTSINYIVGQISALNNIGRLHRKKTDYKLAIKNHKKALNIAVDYKLKDVEASCLNLIGVVYRRKDDIKSAIDYHQSAISVAMAIHPPNVNTNINISIAQNSLGNIYSSLRQYTKAIQQFNQAIIIQQQTKNLKGLAINYQNIGEAFEGLKLYDKAMYNYKKSLEYNKKLNSDFGKLICINSISSVLIKQKRYNKALQKISSILPLSIEVNHPNFLTQTYSNLGLVQLKLGDYSNSKLNLKKALTIIDDFEVLKKHQIQVHFNLSELYKKLKNYEEAYRYMKMAFEEEKETQGVRNTIYVNNLMNKQELQNKINEFNDLENKTKIKSLELSKSRNILIITLVSIGLISLILYSIYRQHLLQNDRKILRLEQKALQAQMNPHFIFNALNSIKLYIISNEQKSAVFYLNKFSKLIRNILEVSKVREVSLKEELNTMSLYMSIESIRFSSAINYIEKITPNLNTDTIKIPPLVLQPFLENSIWHGLSSKEGKKEIIVEVYKVDANNSIEINIIDNGIGREAAEKIKEKKSLSLKRKSIGISLTTERLITFYDEFSEEFSLTYYDLKDDDKKPIGTKVTLVIPVV